jgi:hypothetical protein
MDSVRLDGESRFKALDFNRGEEKILSVAVTPDFSQGETLREQAWGILNSEFCLLTPSHI